MTPDSREGTASKRHPGGRGALLSGGLAAILASSCCLGPLVLLTLGVSGAWISRLTLLEPYQPLFIGAAVIALVLSYRRMRQPVGACGSAEACALPRASPIYQLLFWTAVALVIATVGFPLIARWFY